MSEKQPEVNKPEDTPTDHQECVDNAQARLPTELDAAVLNSRNYGTSR